jgi:hypothetical protein
MKLPRNHLDYHSMILWRAYGAFNIAKKSVQSAALINPMLALFSHVCRRIFRLFCKSHSLVTIIIKHLRIGRPTDW